MMLRNKKIVTLVMGIVLLLLLVVGVTYAFYSENIEGKVEHITGQIYMNYEETTTISLQDAIPETKEQALARTDNNGVFEFTITGRNTSKNPVYYEIDLLEGNVSTTKTTRILPEHIRIYLERDGEVLIDGKTYNNWNNKRIYVETIPANTKDNITHNYTLRMWFDENIIVSDTDPNADYTTEEWNNGYASLKVRVVGDLEEKDLRPTLVETIETNIPDNIQEADDEGNRYLSGGYSTSNYVWYSGKMWRIVSINSDNTVKLVTDGNMTTLAWSTASDNTVYKNSQIHNWLKNEFLPTLVNADTVLADSTWDYTTYAEASATKAQPTAYVENEKVGLLTIYDYYKVRNGSNSNFLNNGYYWWMMSPQTDNSSVWSVYYYGSTGDTSPTNSRGVRPSVNLKSGIKVMDGEGTKSNPYILLGDKATGTTSELLNNRISGEYIKFNDVTYRIVGTDEIKGQKLTKIVMADNSVNDNTLTTGIAFGANSDQRIFSHTYGIGLYLENWYEADSASTTYANTYIQDDYKQMIATSDENGVIWYTGPTSGTGNDYTLSKTGTPVSATIGLGYYGEMFSFQTGDAHLWLMTIYSASKVWGVSYVGDASYFSPSYYDSYDPLGVRPSMYLKSNVEILSGTGMPHDPYEIAYVPKLLSEEVEEKLTLTTAENDCTNYVYGGDVDNNYVWYSGKLWRIVAINCDGTVKLVTQGAMTTVAFNVSDDDVFYENSQIHNWLKNEFLPTLSNTDKLLADSTWDYTAYAEASATKVEPVNYVENEKVGLLTVYDYEMTGSASGFLNNGYTCWTMSQQSDTSFWAVGATGSVFDATQATSYGVRPSVNLKSNVEFKGGDGTKTNPYVITGDKATGKSSELLSNRISGEYIKFNDVLYRIVGTEIINNQTLTKITMADYSVNRNSLNVDDVRYGLWYDEELIYSTTYGIGKYLEEWYQADSTSTTYAANYIKDVYKAMIATSDDGVVWYQGPSGGVNYDYTLSKTGITISTPIGLPYYGEMFSSQFGEGRNLSKGFWSMTINSNTDIWFISEFATGSSFNLDNGTAFAQGARPSFYLKNDVKITSGSGMPHDPYVITQ